MLKITGGFLKGHPIKSPSSTIRPTTEKVRKAVFDMLGPSIHDSIFLDVFSGTGAIGMEALSRGAKKVYFIENNRKLAKAIIDMLHHYQLEGSGQVLSYDALKGLKHLVESQINAHFIFIDAPYELYTKEPDLFVSIIKIIEDTQLLAIGGILFIEDQGKIDYSKKCNRLNLMSTRNYGSTYIHKLVKT